MGFETESHYVAPSDLGTYYAAQGGFELGAALSQPQSAGVSGMHHTWFIIAEYLMNVFGYLLELFCLLFLMLVLAVISVNFQMCINICYETK